MPNFTPSVPPSDLTSRVLKQWSKFHLLGELVALYSLHALFVFQLLQTIVFTQSADSGSSSATTAVPVSFQNSISNGTYYSTHALTSAVTAPAALTTANRGSISSTVAPKVQRKRGSSGKVSITPGRGGGKIYVTRLSTPLVAH